MKIDPRMEPYRIRSGAYGSDHADSFGMFDAVVGPCGQVLAVGYPEKEVEAIVEATEAKYKAQSDQRQRGWDDQAVGSWLRVHEPETYKRILKET